MGDNQNTVNNLIGGIEFRDSRLASLLQTLANDLYGLNRQINPPETQSKNLIIGGGGITVVPATGFTILIFLNDIRLNWNVPSTGIFLYEVRLGTVYETANILLTTATHSADIDPVSRFIVTNANYTFWLTTEDEFGNRSLPLTSTINIPAIGASNLTGSVVGNSVLLRWTAPTSSFQIKHYIVYRNGAVIGTLNGTFDVVFEPVAGSYSYQVQAVDIVGNLGPISGVVDFALGNPTDYFLFATINDPFAGGKVNCAVDMDGRLLMNISTTDTWTDHFVNNGWTTIQQQITAGYPYYWEPGP
jgi:hypothetical protein